MQSIEEKIYEVFWDKNIARMINRADLFSFLKQYVNPGLLTRSSKSELVYDLNANKYHKKKLEYYQMKKVLLSILEPAHIQKGEVLQRKRTYDYEEGYEDILKSGNYVNNSGFYDPDRKEHVEFVVQMIPETVYYLTYTLSNRTFRVPLEESEIKQYPDLEVVDVGRITPVYGDITADMLSVQFVDKIVQLIKGRKYELIFENNTDQETEEKDELTVEPVTVDA